MNDIEFFVYGKSGLVKMQRVDDGIVDLSTIASLKRLDRDKKTLKVITKGEGLNPSHLNFRVATLDYKQTNYVMTPFDTKIDSSSYKIEFDSYTKDDGGVFQLLYRGEWYALMLGDPKDALYEAFSKEPTSLERAISSIKSAKKAYPNDEFLAKRASEFKRLLDEKRADEAKEAAKYSAPHDKPIKVIFH